MQLLGSTRLHKLWDQLRSSYWFVPTLITIATSILALLLMMLDERYPFDRTSRISWLFLGKAESVRSILSTIAGAMITIVSLTFSMTIVVLTLASSQYGPRLLYNFMRDRSNQVALGVFVACFVYCLLVLRTVQGEESQSFVPHFSANGAIALAVLSLGVLIYFIHHVAESIQANTVVASVRRELESVVVRMLPQEASQTPESDAEWNRLKELAETSSTPIPSKGRGILQAIDQDALLNWAREHDVLLALRHRPGDFVIDGNIILDAFPAERIRGEDIQPPQEAFTFGTHRTLVQDVEFAFQQLVELAVRALSPGINDPFTAMSCIEELGAGLVLVARRAPQPRLLRDADGMPRVLLKPVDFRGVADVAFNQIRQNGANHPAVMIRLLETLAAVAPAVNDAGDRMQLLRHAEAVHAAARTEATDAGDRADIDQRFAHAARALGGSTMTSPA